MKFETITYSDLEKIRFLQPEGWSDIVPEFNAYIRKDFCHPVKATIENKIVGIGVAIALETTGWLAHIVVDINYRNQGIGYQIVDELIGILKKRSVAIFLLIATANGKPVYLKAGFRDVTEYIFFKRESQWIEKPLSDNIVPYNNLYYRRIIEMDRAICGENREGLIKNHLSGALLYVERNELLGYYVPGPGEGLIFGCRLMSVAYYLNHSSLKFTR